MIGGRRFTLPTGRTVSEAINTRTGEVSYFFETSEAINALDAMELGQLAERALRGFTFPDWQKPEPSK